MKVLFLITSLLTFTTIYSQDEKISCTGLPVAKPAVKASISIADVTAKFQADLPANLKKGTHSAVYKIFVDCNGDVTQATYQSGTLSETDQKNYETKILALKWKPATNKSKPVTSVVFVSIEVVNGKVEVVI